MIVLFCRDFRRRRHDHVVDGRHLRYPNRLVACRNHDAGGAWGSPTCAGGPTPSAQWRADKALVSRGGSRSPAWFTDPSIPRPGALSVRLPGTRRLSHAVSRSRRFVPNQAGWSGWATVFITDD